MTILDDVTGKTQIACSPDSKFDGPLVIAYPERRFDVKQTESPFSGAMEIEHDLAMQFVLAKYSLCRLALDRIIEVSKKGILLW